MKPKKINNKNALTMDVCLFNLKKILIYSFNVLFQRILKLSNKAS
jgi:hypothetical protein